MTEPRRRALVLASLALALPLSGLAATAAGSVPLSASSVLGGLVSRLGLQLGTEPLGPAGEAILWSVRVPRVLLAALVGGGLAVVGAALQSVFRNPMADSGLLGVGSGAALGACHSNPIRTACATLRAQVAACEGVPMARCGTDAASPPVSVAAARVSDAECLPQFDGVRPHHGAVCEPPEANAVRLRGLGATRIPSCV